MENQQSLSKEQTNKILTSNSGQVSEPTRVTYKCCDSLNDLKIANVNSRRQFERYGSTMASMSVWERMPKFVFKNGDNDKQFDMYSLQSDFFKLLKKCESLLYRHGYCALYAGGRNEIARLGEVILAQYDDVNNLIKLVVNVKTTKKQSIEYCVLEKYDIVNPKTYVQTATISRDTLNTLLKNGELEKIIFSDSERLNTSYGDVIPWIVLENNFMALPDLDNVDPALFQMFDDDLKAFSADTKISQPVFGATNKIISELASAINDPRKKIFAMSDLLLNRGLAQVNMIQASPQAQFIIQKLNFNQKLIKQMAYLPKDNTDSGVKQLTSGEVNDMNYDFDKFTLEKINMREISLQEYINLWMRLNNIQDTCEVTCYGSSKWNDQQVQKQQALVNFQNQLNNNQVANEQQGAHNA